MPAENASYSKFLAVHLVTVNFLIVQSSRFELSFPQLCCRVLLEVVYCLKRAEMPYEGFFTKVSFLHPVAKLTMQTPPICAL